MVAMTMTLDPTTRTRTTAKDAEQAAVDAAWATTIAKRLDDLESGRVKPVSGRETSQMIDAMIRDWPE